MAGGSCPLDEAQVAFTCQHWQAAARLSCPALAYTTTNVLGIMATSCTGCVIHPYNARDLGYIAHIVMMPFLSSW